MGDTTIKLISCESGDWEILELNGETYSSEHKMENDDWIRLIKTLTGIEIEKVTISDEEIEDLC